MREIELSGIPLLLSQADGSSRRVRTAGQNMTDPLKTSNLAQRRVGGELYIVAAAVLWSTSGFFAKSPWFDGWPEEIRGVQLAFWRSLFAGVCLLPLVRRPQWRWSMLPMLVAFAVMVWSFLSAMVAGPAASAIWLQYLSPAWVTLISAVIFREPIERRDAGMLSLCLAGVLLMASMEIAVGGNPWATTLGIVSGIAFAIVLICMRRLSDVDAAWLITINHAATVLLLLPWAWGVPRVGAGAYVALGLFGIFQMSVPYILLSIGLRRATAARASALTLIEPTLLPVWVYLAWRNHPSYEAPPWWTFVGGGLIAVGLFVGRRRQQVESP